jgi:hypothetical protein
MITIHGFKSKISFWKKGKEFFLNLFYTHKFISILSKIQCMDMVPSSIQVKSSLNHNVQNQRLSTLDTISPTRAKRLEESRLFPLLSVRRLKLYLELKDASKCVVGEAYGFNRKS